MAILQNSAGVEILPRYDSTTSGTLNALNAELVLGGSAPTATNFIDGCNTVAIDLRTAALNATLSFEASADGTNYYAIPVVRQDTQALTTTVTTSTTLGVTCLAYVGGWRQIRVRVSAYTSGSVVVSMRGSLAAVPNHGLKLPYPSTLAVTVTAAAASGATLTIPAGGAGLYHYITSIEITRNATAALAGTATLVITTTNLPGSLAWSVGNAMAAGGTQIDVSRDFANPLKSSVANTNTTIVMPAPGAAVLWRANAYYYLGS